MAAVGIFEAKNRFSELVERAMGGEEIIITRRGEQVARLMPPRAADALGAAQILAGRIRTSRASFARNDSSLGSTVQPLWEDVLNRGGIRDMIEEGRR